MKYLIIFLISFNIFSNTPVLSLVEDVPKDVKDFGSKFRELNKKDYLLGSGIIAADLILMNFDEDIKTFANKNRSDTLDTLAPVFRKFGEFYPPLIFFGVGYIFDNDKSTEAGLYSAEASFLGLGITFIAKNIFTRARPYTGEGSDSWNNERFNKDYSSFPSGHSTVSFATAAVIAEMYKDKKGIPELMYTLASLAAASRIYNDKHWASDVFLGSCIGYFTGKTFMEIKKKSDMYLGPQSDGSNFGITLGGQF